jgi:hypothetical protein
MTQTRMQTCREAMVAQCDGDGSGDLNAEERAALRELVRARIRGEHFMSEDTF